MLIMLIDNKLIWTSVLFCLTVEILRIIIANIFARPSNEIEVLHNQKFEANQEIAAIKSVQLELVKHSLLTRKLIKIDKQIEKLQSEYAPRQRSVKNSLRIVRIVLYAAFSLYHYYSTIFVINPKILWPVSVFVYNKTCSVPVWFFVFVTAFSCRHILKTFSQIIFRQRELV